MSILKDVKDKVQEESQKDRLRDLEMRLQLVRNTAGSLTKDELTRAQKLLADNGLPQVAATLVAVMALIRP